MPAGANWASSKSGPQALWTIERHDAPARTERLAPRPLHFCPAESACMRQRPAVAGGIADRIG
jgi:hypothetical protein